MDSDQGKLFIGGFLWETTEEKLRNYFKSYGMVTEIIIVKESVTGRSHGFGFVTLADPSVVERVAWKIYTIDGRKVDVEEALLRAIKQQNMPRSKSGVAKGHQCLRPGQRRFSWGA